MGECICNSCLNLKGIIDDAGAIENYECRFGFPADECSEDCEKSDCSLTCANYLSDESEEEQKMVRCAGCGKELRQLCGDDVDDGSTYCLDCYFKKK